MSSRGRSARRSSMRTPGKSFRWTDLRSEPEPLTRRTSTARPRWSRSVRLMEVLPPPQTTSEVSAPTRRDAYTRRSRSSSEAASASFQRERTIPRYHDPDAPPGRARPRRGARAPGARRRGRDHARPGRRLLDGARRRPAGGGAAAPRVRAGLLARAPQGDQRRVRPLPERARLDVAAGRAALRPGRRRREDSSGRRGPMGRRPGLRAPPRRRGLVGRGARLLRLARTAAPEAGRPLGASPWGVHDLLGNLREWTQTVLRPYPYRHDDGREGGNGRDRVVVRGASHDDPAASLSVTARRSYDRRGAAGRPPPTRPPRPPARELLGPHGP